MYELFGIPKNYQEFLRIVNDSHEVNYSYELFKEILGIINNFYELLGIPQNYNEILRIVNDSQEF